MDPITTAIVTALSAGVLDSLTEASKAAVSTAYTQLKTHLTNTFGKTSAVVQAVEQVEAKPDSPGRQATLQEEVVQIQAYQDVESLRLAEVLQQVLQASASTSSTGTHIQQAHGSYIAQADRGSSASVQVGQTPRPL
jgi:hypothetical protein